jgi:hypothetical protein
MMRKRNLLFLLFVVSLQLLFSNCGEMKSSKKISGNIFSLKAEKSVSVASKSQILISYARCLNLADDQIRPETIATYKESLSAFSLSGKADTITAPMMMSIVSVVGEICLDLINAEKNKSDRFVLRGFNLGGTTNAQEYNLHYSIQSLATSCWSRSALEEEVNIIIKSLTDAGLNGKKNAAEALFLCTSVLSSSEAIRR